MIEFEIKSKKQTIGAKKGQTVYYAVAKNSNRMTLDAVCQQIVDETSLPCASTTPRRWWTRKSM